MVSLLESGYGGQLVLGECDVVREELLALVWAHFSDYHGLQGGGGQVEEQEQRDREAPGRYPRQ